MAVMIYDFIEEIEEVKVRDISLYEEPVKYDPIEIDLVDIKTDKVIGDTYQRKTETIGFMLTRLTI